MTDGPAGQRRRGLRNWQLFAVCVLVWGTTWHVITHQVGNAAAEVAVALRFALAGALVLGWRALRGDRLWFSTRQHALLALQGVFMYGVSYVCVYHAELHVPSGLVSVGYSASPLITGLAAMLLFGVVVSRRFVLGGVLGVIGVGLIFWPEFGRAGSSAQVSHGVLFTAGSVLLSAVGSVAASRNRANDLPFWPSLGMGMLYGALAAAATAWVLGRPFALPADPAWWAALAYLVLAGSVLAFACFLKLQERVGPGPAGAIGVLTPLVALAVSVALEGFVPSLLTLAGAALAVAGNVMMLRNRAAG